MAKKPNVELPKNNMIKRKKRQFTLGEFRAWLDGIEELQPSNWSPSLEQWKLIRQRISSIVETSGHNVIESARQEPQIRKYTNVTDSRTFSPPPMSGGVPDGSVEISPEAKALLSGDATSKKHKTPNIDTTGGGYTSPLA